MDVAIRDLTFNRGRRTILDVPRLDVADGRVAALVGPNGSGKSTLLRLIAGLERPRTGAIEVGGRPPGSPAIAFAFQRATFLSGTVRENLELALRLRGLARGEARDRAVLAADACGVGHLLSRQATRLSGGEAQRTNLARALALRAPVTLLDEPLSGLDAPGRRALLHDLPGLLKDFASTVIIVTHDRDEALRLADDLVVLIDGRVRAAGERATVFGDPPDADTAAFLGWTLLPGDRGTTVAIAPRGLRHGPGETTFAMRVEEVLDFGVRREAWGTVDGVRVSVGLPAGDGPVEAEIAVSAGPRALKRFGTALTLDPSPSAEGEGGRHPSIWAAKG